MNLSCSGDWAGKMLRELIKGGFQINLSPELAIMKEIRPISLNNFSSSENCRKRAPIYVICLKLEVLFE